MNKIIISVITVLTLLFTGCKTSSSDPRSVLMSFVDALGKKDINVAKKFATKDSEAMLGMIQMGMAMATDSIKDKTYDKNNMEFGKAIITGDKATVPAKDKNSGEVINYALLKESGEWKVAFDMGTMMEIGKAKMKEHGLNIKEGMDSAVKMLNNINILSPDSAH